MKQLTKDTPSNRIKDLLEKYYHEVLSKNSSFKHCRREHPLLIEHLSDVSAKGFKYIPEIYFEKKSRNIISFQVFDNQDRKGRAGDILCSFFTKNLRRAYFIVINNKEEGENEEEIETINNLITAVESQFEKEFEAKYLPQCLPSAFVITLEETKDKDKFFQKIDSIRNRDKW